MTIDIHTATYSELVAYAREKVLEQGGAAMDRRGNCVYYFESGNTVRRCAVGHLLTEEQAISATDCGLDARALLKSMTYCKPFDERRARFLCLLQSAHDYAGQDAIDADTGKLTDEGFAELFITNLVKLERFAKMLDEGDDFANKLLEEITSLKLGFSYLGKAMGELDSVGDYY
jgi:hypothetical protein